jgi:hypothetical protein
MAEGTYKGVRYFGTVVGSKLPPGKCAAHALFTSKGITTVKLNALKIGNTDFCSGLAETGLSLQVNCQSLSHLSAKGSWSFRLNSWIAIINTSS